MTCKIHILKISPLYYKAVDTGVKTFEIRVNDRDFKIGDILILNEYDDDTSDYSGRFMIFTIGYILHGVLGMDNNLCCMSLNNRYH
jgi:hypothetical protein